MIVGHSPIRRYLEKVLHKGTWAHGYLLHGPEHVGKTTVAFAFARSLLCEGKMSQWGGCGACASCTRQDLRLSDRFFYLEPRDRDTADEKNTTRAINIEEVWELRRWLSYASVKTRVILIQRAETMSRDATNALLKILEEPNPGMLFLFVTSTPQYILATVRSRVVSLRFSFVAEKDIAGMKGASPELVAVAAGRPGVLVSAAVDPLYRAREEKFHRTAENLWKGYAAEACLAAKEFADVGEGEKTVILHLLRLAGTDAPVLDAEKLPRLLHRVSAGLRAVSRLATTNVNRRLALDIAFLNLQRVRS